MRFLILALLLTIYSPLKTRLASLDPLSVAEHFAFYELYPETEEGRQALSRAWNLLSGGKVHLPPTLLPSVDIRPLITLITGEAGQKHPPLSAAQLEAVAEDPLQRDND